MPRTSATASAGASASSDPSPRELRSRRRDVTRRRTAGGGDFELVDLPPDVLVHVLVLLPCVEDLCRVDGVCRLFAFGTPTFGKHSLVEAALRIRHVTQTGKQVPGSLVREPWWPWSSTKAKLVHDERCRRGARLIPLVPPSVVNSEIDLRKGVAFFRRSGPGVPPPDMVLGRMTRALDNGQGIQDPRVSRQHLKLMLVHGEAHEPNGVCKVQALGHNPSTIRRGKLASLGVGFHAEPPSFKLRRGDIATLYPGDVIQLVCEDVSRAHGRSLPFEGNACAYQVDFVSGGDSLPADTVVLGRDAEDTDEEASANGDGPSQPPETMAASQSQA